jgi:hypothetical protein
VKGRATGWDFRGREGEIAALEAGWQVAGEDERAPILVVHGAPWIGKTRMVAEFARSVGVRDAEVLWGVAYEGGSSPPYVVWREAIGYATRLGGVGLEALLGDEARWLAPLAPDGVLSGGAPIGVPAAVARRRLAEVLARMLDALPARAVVILDDMPVGRPRIARGVWSRGAAVTPLADRDHLSRSRPRARASAGPAPAGSNWSPIRPPRSR